MPIATELIPEIGQALSIASMTIVLKVLELAPTNRQTEAVTGEKKLFWETVAPGKNWLTLELMG